MIPRTAAPQILSEIEVMRKEIEVLRQRRLQRAERNSVLPPRRPCEPRPPTNSASRCRNSQRHSKALENLENPSPGAVGELSRRDRDRGVARRR